MKTLNDLFHIRHGNKLDLNKMTRLSVANGGVNFVGRSSERHGISASIAAVPNVDPFEKGTITVALGGTKLLSAFVQDDPFYTAQNVVVLTPRGEISFAEKVYLCICIRHNRWLYSAFGREANRTVRDIRVPYPVPAYVETASSLAYDGLDAPAVRPTRPVDNPLAGPTATIPLRDLFDLRPGHSLELIRMQRAVAPEGVNFVGRAIKNNGVTARVHLPKDAVAGEAGQLTVALGGNGVLSTFVQTEPFLCGRDVAILVAKNATMSVAEKIWWSTCIYANRYRFSYGRQANRTLASMLLPTPTAPTATDRSKLIEQFMRSLPFSGQAEVPFVSVAPADDQLPAEKKEI
jgi:hypothetical protein